ncbi:LLM class F420-dependent oxidoreductase [Promicromonospora thailandica]|uniref:F420-dependent oxidoreductase, Rv1855c family n=1 Tax=Promicromonospora thailandica TaxID=765201 RepID=A0A9X2G772_9MICO|nr:LLM class F420-dependent oxidoreductase [Promicromonospora thailandica]MCP2266833.1 putative F420-dependent oxidoreductase, Rv1855c family [Promicromonospora thailandica]BFF16492.1 TIGR03560 family F420-dependent LLM class oxidoreductase [Promicromonospora thailandica]BFF22006.1 TIGR03560 family F420-dependent LLM class oxidoreductase [Promicromonospora thailandica]
MDLGLHYFTFTHPEWETTLADRLTETAQIADQGGVNLMSLMDHWFQMLHTGGPYEPMLEGYTTLGYLAGVTKNVRLSLLVTGVTYRRPGLLAKTVSTLDVLSRGRAMLGIGAAWYDREHAGLGVPFPPTAERFERLEETLQICRQMWSDDDGPYEGTHYQLAETINLPQPPRGSVPVMIGGGGERKTLRLVAQYAQACNLFGSPGQEGLDFVGHKLDVLREHCDRLGTDYDAIEKTMLYQGDAVADPDAFLTDMEKFRGLGITLVGLTPPLYQDPVPWATQLVETVRPRLADI